MPKPPRRYWTSDPHIGHHAVATKFRPFKTVEDHDRTLAERWDSVIRPNDIVYVQGDIAISPSRDHAFEWFAERPGIKHLVTGNHDAIHPLFGSRAQRERRKAMDQLYRNTWAEAQGDDHFTPSWFDVFETIQEFAMTTINGTKVMMSHFPYRGEGNRDLEERYSEFRLRDEGLLLLHGHTHSHRKVSSLTNGGAIHVGVDAWDWTPVPEAQIVEKMGLIARFQKVRDKK